MLWLLWLIVFATHFNFFHFFSEGILFKKDAFTRNEISWIQFSNILQVLPLPLTPLPVFVLIVLIGHVSCSNFI